MTKFKLYFTNGCEKNCSEFESTDASVAMQKVEKTMSKRTPVGTYELFAVGEFEENFVASWNVVK